MVAPEGDFRTCVFLEANRPCCIVVSSALSVSGERRTRVQSGELRQHKGLHVHIFQSRLAVLLQWQGRVKESGSVQNMVA